MVGATPKTTGKTVLNTRGSNNARRGFQCDRGQEVETDAALKEAIASVATSMQVIADVVKLEVENMIATVVDMEEKGIEQISGEGTVSPQWWIRTSVYNAMEQIILE